MQQFKPLRLERNAQPTYTRDVATRAIHPSDEAVLHRVAAGLKNNRYIRGSRFCGETRSGGVDCRNHSNLVANKINRQRRQLVILTCRRAVLDHHILALDVACLTQTLLKGSQALLWSRCTAEKPDHRHGR